MKIRASMTWLEILIYFCLGALVGLLIWILSPKDIAIYFLIGLGIAGSLLFYLVYRLDLSMWMSRGCSRIIAVCFPAGPGTGFIILVLGDLIRLLAYQFYNGDDFVDFAIWRSKTKKRPVEGTAEDRPPNPPGPEGRQNP